MAKIRLSKGEIALVDKAALETFGEFALPNLGRG